MEQRLSLVTLGVSDVPAARAFYEALGWTCDTDPALDVAFFQLGGIALAVWDRKLLAEDSTVVDRGGFGGVTLAYNVRSAEEVDAVLAEAEAAGATIGRRARARSGAATQACSSTPTATRGRSPTTRTGRSRTTGRSGSSSLPTGGESCTQTMKIALSPSDTKREDHRAAAVVANRKTSAAPETRNEIVMRMFCASHCQEFV